MATLDQHHPRHNSAQQNPGFKRWGWLAAAVVAALLILYLFFAAVSPTPRPAGMADGGITAQEEAVIQPAPPPAAPQ